MKTYLHLLWVGFWMLPVQRLCTVLGCSLALLAGAFGSSFGLANAFGVISVCVIIIVAPVFLLGGAFWRALSAPRAVVLAPYGRVKLLAAVSGFGATIVLLWLACYAFTFLGLPLNYRMGFAGYWRLFVDIFASTTWWAIATFIASRSPLAALGVLLFWICSAYVLDMLGLENFKALWGYNWSIAAPLALWALFGIWYLRARRIAPPGWLIPGGHAFLATVATIETAAVTRFNERTALEYLLLGGTSVLRVLVQWLLASGALLAVLQLLGRQDAEKATIAAHVAFAGLILCPAIVAAQSLAIVRRARALWLPSGYSRKQLFALTERTLLKFALGMALMFAGFLLGLWYTQPWHPAMTLIQALCVLVVPTLLVANHALSRPRGRDYYWRWPGMMLLCWFLAWRPLTATDPATWAGPRGWAWIAVALLIGIALRTLARFRWLVEDLPRAATSPLAAS